MFKTLLQSSNIPLQSIQLNGPHSKHISLQVLRLDMIHPVISGNKLYKLRYFLDEAIALNKPVETFGGAYSNHLVATAFACKVLGLPCIGHVRGEQMAELNATLTYCQSLGMDLRFLPRSEYAGRAKNLASSGNVIVPEGGYDARGALGAASILDNELLTSATHICTAVGTATTLAGLCRNANGKIIIGVPVIKNMTDVYDRVAFLNEGGHYDLPVLIPQYHFGGYARHQPELFAFMNNFYKQHRIPTDFVYTAKLFYGITDLIRQDYFKAGSSIVLLHTGGLQGNNSLPNGTLCF